MNQLTHCFSDLNLRQTPPLASLAQLPDDLLYHLFQSIVLPNPAESFGVVVTLSHVCATWREILVHAPSFWTYIQMPTRHRRVEHSAVLTSFLQRSRDILVQLHFRVHADAEPLCPQLIAALTPHAHRFSSMLILIHPRASLVTPLQIISTLDMPNLRYFDLAISGQQRCILSMHNRSPFPIQSDRFQIMPHSPTPYLDWSVRHFHLTSLTLKYLDLSCSNLLPILISARSSLVHLEFYSDFFDPCAEFVFLPRIILPHLTSLRVGYRRPEICLDLVERLVLPVLSSLSVHDFGRCPEVQTPPRFRDSFYGRCQPEDKDAVELLTELCPFTTLTHLTLLGVCCPLTQADALSLPLQYLFENLESLSLIKCDDKFMEGLAELTKASSGTTFHRMGNLKDLRTTCIDYSLLRRYLAWRADRGLPKLKTIAVHPRMSLLRHFYDEYAERMEVLGRSRVAGPPDWKSMLYIDSWYSRRTRKLL